MTPPLPRPRVVFWGTPDFAVPALRTLHELADICLVVSQPDRPTGRGRQIKPTPVRATAEELSLLVVQPTRLRVAEFHDQLRALRADLFFTAAYGRILPPAVLAIPPRGCLNLHASLLPRHRGAAPIQWSILSGDTETGLTLMLMEEGLDTGPLLARHVVPIDPDETAGELTHKLEQAAPAFLRDALPRFLAGELTPVLQPTTGVTLAPPLTREQGRLDFTASTEQLRRQVRGLTPWPGTHCLLGAIPLRIAAVRPRPDHPTLPGEPPGLLVAQRGTLLVRTGDGWLAIERLQAAGKREMTAREYLSGRPIKPGEQLRMVDG